MTDTAQDLLYLLGCALQQKVPDTEAVRRMDMKALLSMSRYHKVGAMAAMALDLSEEGGGPVISAQDRKAWQQLRDRAIRKNVLFDAEREKILAHFDGAGIWYLPLKGILLQGDYPRYGMREMSDNDILYDRTFQNSVRDYMQSQGYEVKAFGHTAHDIYHKPPVFNFELHTMLFDYRMGRDVTDYYADVKDRLQKDPGNACGYHFLPDDFYIYVTVHAFKHYRHGGTGFRALTDNYVMRHLARDERDWEYIDQELARLGILETDRTIRSLADRLFDDPRPDGMAALSADERKMLAYLTGSGAYGTEANHTRNELRSLQEDGKPISRKTKAKYVLRRIFPSMAHMKRASALVSRFPFIAPLWWVYRNIRAVLFRRRKLKTEMSVLRSRDTEKGQ